MKKVGDLVTPNKVYESYGLDPLDPRNHGLPEWEQDQYMKWNVGDVGIVVEVFELWDTFWVKLVVPEGVGYCHADELIRIKAG